MVIRPKSDPEVPRLFFVWETAGRMLNVPLPVVTRAIREFRGREASNNGSG